MAYSSNSGAAPVTRRCGKFQGYWTVADWIGYSNNANWGSCNLYDHYGMGNNLPLGPTSVSYGNSTLTSGAAKYADMFGCQPTTNDSLNSGYSYTLNVCGCYDWNQVGSSAPTAQAYNCKAVNSQWTSTVLDRIKWLKQACPTAYSYQFDDPSSQFTCNIAQQKTSYQLTFCPAGKTGRPA